MRAAVLTEFGQPPREAEVDTPTRTPGHALVHVTAAPLNPLDLLVASGRFYGYQPQLPYVPGVEGVGVVVQGESLVPGSLVRFQHRAGVDGPGSLAEYTLVDEASALGVPDGVDHALAASLGVSGITAWLALCFKARLEAGEGVLVLGATGAVGQIALQVARVLGAGRVVAAGRDPEGLARAKSLGADAVVDLRAGSSPAEWAAALRAACPSGIDVVVDPVWGLQAIAALDAASPGARLVNVGGSAGAEAPLSSAVIRGKRLAVLGLSHTDVPREEVVKAYGALMQHAAVGSLQVAIVRLPLGRVGYAWERQASSPHAKQVFDPRLTE